MPKMPKKNMPGLNLDSTNMDFVKQAKLVPESDQEDGKVLPQNRDGANDVVNQWMKEFEVELRNDIPSVFDQVKTAPAAKKKGNLESDSFMNVWKKKFGMVTKKQAEKRKRHQENMLHSLQTVVSRLEADTVVLNDNNQRLREWCGSILKQSQQTVNANLQKIETLKQIVETYTKDCENAENAQQQETRALDQELSTSVKELQERLQRECRRKSAEALQKAMSAMIE